MCILTIKYRERGTYPNEHEETKVFSAIDLRYYIISYAIYIKVEENGHTFIDNSK